MADQPSNDLVFSGNGERPQPAHDAEQAQLRLLRIANYPAQLRAACYEGHREVERIADELEAALASRQPGPSEFANLDATLARLDEQQREIERLKAGPSEPPPVSDLVTCSLRDPDSVCHLPRLDCQHEAPHLIAACGAFSPVSDPVVSAEARLRKLIITARRKSPTHGAQEWDWLLGELAILATHLSHVERAAKIQVLQETMDQLAKPNWVGTQAVVAWLRARIKAVTSHPTQEPEP